MTTTATDAPHEVRLLGACMGDDGQTVAQALARRVKPETYAVPTRGMIFKAICDLYRDRRPISAATVAELLRDNGELEAVGGYHALMECGDAAPTTAHAANDIDRVLTAHALRVVARHAKAAAALAEATDGGDLAHRLDEIMPHLRAAQEAGTPAEVRNLATIAEAAAADLESEKPRGIPGPFPLWDREAGELRPGELAILAARTGQGKTSLALQHAEACIAAAKACTIFTLEMTGEELCERLARQSCGIGASRSDLAAWIRTNLGYEKLLTIYDGAATLEQIESRCRLLATHPRGLGLVVVDYLQLVTPPAELRRDNRERQVATVSRGLKLMALDLRVPVLVLSQLNRDCEKEDRQPRLTDLRESGSIEQDADAVWFLHPVTADCPQVADAPRITVELQQAKRRAGPAGVGVPLSFHRPSTTFTLAAAEQAESGR